MTWNLARFFVQLLRTAGKDINRDAWINYLKGRILGPWHRRFGPDALPYGPDRVYLSVTNACNQRCRFCSYRDELQAVSNSDSYMSMDTFYHLLENRRVREALGVHFYGGEPLLHDSLPEMIRMARSSGHVVVVNTNGLLLGEKAVHWKGALPHALSISYDVEHEKELAEGLGSLPEKPVIKLCLVVSRKRLHQLESFFSFASKNDILFVEIVNLQLSPDKNDEPLMAGDPDFMAMKHRFDTEFGGRHVIFWPPLQRSGSHAVHSRCDLFWNTLFLDIEGALSPCCYLPLASYENSMLDDPDSWNGPRMRSLRRMMRCREPPSFCSQCAYLDYDEMP